MPHLHLPIDHTDADLVLAANLAEIVGSEDLYVAWSHDSGAGAVPEVEAVLLEHHPISPFAEFFAALGAGFAGMFRALLGRPGHAAVQHTPPVDPARQPRQPSA
jgi:hypothetical protein